MDKTDPTPSHDDVLALPAARKAKASATGGMNSAV